MTFSGPVFNTMPRKIWCYFLIYYRPPLYPRIKGPPTRMLELAVILLRPLSHRRISISFLLFILMCHSVWPNTLYSLLYILFWLLLLYVRPFNSWWLSHSFCNIACIFLSEALLRTTLVSSLVVRKGDEDGSCEGQASSCKQPSQVWTFYGIQIMGGCFILAQRRDCFFCPREIRESKGSRFSDSF